MCRILLESCRQVEKKPLLVFSSFLQHKTQGDEYPAYRNTSES
jgi:hypothetical protein